MYTTFTLNSGYYRMKTFYDDKENGEVLNLYNTYF